MSDTYVKVTEFCRRFDISRSHYYKRLEAVFIAEKIMLNVPPPDGPPRIALGRAERWLLKNQDPK